jgi:predicted  nucleic acid-binding Zn-ribbon protein
MRCPQCGYHSFDYLDNCKKCGSDLTERKLRFRFQGYVAPSAEEAAAEPEPEESPLPEEAEAESEAIDFGFDILEGLDVQAEGRGEAEPPLPACQPAGGEEIDDPFAIDLAAESGLNFDQPFDIEGESLPGDELPKLDDRFNF